MTATQPASEADVIRCPPRPSGTLHRLCQTVDLPRPIEQVFPFFADAFNLERLTPSFLRFRVLTPAPIHMRAGLVIDYRLLIRMLPVRWRSLITVWDPPHRFVDVQILGPYRWWHHEHRFEVIPGGTRVTDEVEYAVPGGALVERLLVRPDIERIFAFRHRQLIDLFGSPKRNDQIA